MEQIGQDANNGRCKRHKETRVSNILLLHEGFGVWLAGRKQTQFGQI